MLCIKDTSADLKLKSWAATENNTKNYGKKLIFFYTNLKVHEHVTRNYINEFSVFWVYSLVYDTKQKYTNYKLIFK